MDDLVEARSLVHQGHGLVVQRLEQLRRLVQGQGHAVAPHDGDAVSWEEHLGSQRGHLPEGGRPIARVALHLLRVAGVGRGPDEEVATAQHLALGCPGPRVVVGLASRMVQLERGAADVEAEPVAIGLVRVAVLGGPLQVREPELALVDERVVPGGEHVAVEPRGHGLVGHYTGAGPAPAGRLLLEDGHAEDVVDVAVRVHGCVQRRARPAPELLMHLAGQERAPRVDQHHPVPGKGADIGHRGHEGHAHRHLRQPALRRHRMVLGHVRLAPPQPVGEIQHVERHDGERYRWRAGGSRPGPGPTVETYEAFDPGGQKMLTASGVFPTDRTPCWP